MTNTPAAPMTDSIPVITATIALALVAAAKEQHDQQHDRQRDEQHDRQRDEQHDQQRDEQHDRHQAIAHDAEPAVDEPQRAASSRA